MIVKYPGRPNGRSSGRKAEQSENTRRALLDVARELFAERGYAGTATEEVVQRAGVTRGALYHQFRDKEDLFRAVYEEVERELTERMLAGLRKRVSRDANALERMRAGNEAFLDACLDPAFQRIALIEAPSVLGWNLRSKVARHGLDMIRMVLEAAIEEGSIPEQPVEPMAHLVRAVLNEAALLLARSPDPKAARVEIGEAVDRLIGGLRATG
jgi:AcrR family transcriptional regulator